MSKFYSWQFWHAAKFHLGETFLLNIMGRRNARTIREYSSDPKYTEKRCRDPLEHLHIIFAELAAFGRADVARAAIEYLQTALNPHDMAAVKPLKDTIQDEVLADYAAVALLQDAVADGRSVEEVAALVDEATAEIERSLAKYKQLRKRHAKATD